MSLYVAAIDSAISHSNHNSDREFNSMPPRSEPIGPQAAGPPPWPGHPPCRHAAHRRIGCMAQLWRTYLCPDLL